MRRVHSRNGVASVAVLEQLLRSERRALDELFECLARGEPPGRGSRFHGASLADVSVAAQRGVVRMERLREQIEQARS